MNNRIFVLLCSGQSNMARVEKITNWTPCPNLKVWDYSPLFDSMMVGTKFITPESDSVNYGVLYGNEIAKANQNVTVYVINVSRGSTNLSQWLETANDPNMWTAVSSNTQAALTNLEGKQTVDEIIWWGHESDGSVNADISADKFIDDFIKIIAKIDEQPWANSKQVPIRFHKINPDSNGLSDQINFALESIVLSNRERFSLIDTTHFNYSDNIHLDRDQKEKAAEHAYTTPRPGKFIERAIKPNLLNNGKFSCSKEESSGKKNAR